MKHTHDPQRHAHHHTHRTDRPYAGNRAADSDGKRGRVPAARRVNCAARAGRTARAHLVRSVRRRGTVVSLAAAAAATAALTALALVPAPARAATEPVSGACAEGALCLWERADFKGARHTFELADVGGTGSCVPLPGSTTAEALANRMGRPVTTYQSEECAETGEFQTYPGDGTWVPRSPYRVRAFKIWEH